MVNSDRRDSFLTLSSETIKRNRIFPQRKIGFVCAEKKHYTGSPTHSPSTPFNMIFALHCKRSSRASTHTIPGPRKTPSLSAVRRGNYTGFCDELMRHSAGMMEIDTLGPFPEWHSQCHFQMGLMVLDFGAQFANVKSNAPRNAICGMAHRARKKNRCEHAPPLDERNASGVCIVVYGGRLLRCQFCVFYFYPLHADFLFDFFPFTLSKSCLRCRWEIE